jgi:predicted nucleic acid-binding Zn ribbon protein
MHWRVEQFGRKGSTFYIVTSRSSNETQAKQRT